MRILFTGTSSFTGFWFARELAAAGHQVFATLQGSADAYEGIRKQRVDALATSCTLLPNTSYGAASCFELIESQSSWDLLCHHAADTSDYKSPDFDVLKAVSNNTRATDKVLSALRDRGCSKILLTGSYFESDEGAGSGSMPAFSPYGLSKTLSAQIFRFHAENHGMHLGKFVIPNPFGPYEDPRFTAYLMRTWFAGKVAGVNTPAYIRDNIPISLLASCYASFASELESGTGFSRMNPSCYASTQGDFAIRFAEEMRPRLGLACELDLKKQTEFTEPLMRINTDDVSSWPGWDESAAWDATAEFYRELLSET
ncbi:MAG: NAD-dependent epimerase/dehydratase family protein [Planctomycetota bacterium]|jgi:nucleoside-diphosphate-sugar epimerase